MQSKFWYEKSNQDLQKELDNFLEASSAGNSEIVRNFLGSNVIINFFSLEVVEGFVNKTPLQRYKDLALIFSAQQGHVEIMKMLVDHGADVNANYFENYPPALYQTIMQNKAEAFNYLIRVDTIDLNLSSMGNSLPILLAAFNNRLEMVKALVEKGVDPNSANGQGWTAQSLAAQKGHQQIVEYLNSLLSATKGSGM